MYMVLTTWNTHFIWVWTVSKSWEVSPWNNINWPRTQCGMYALFFSRGKLFLAIIPWANSFSNSWVLFCALKLLSFFFFSFRFFSLYFFLFGPSKMMAPKSPSMWIAVATIANTRKSTIFQTTSFETGRSRRAFAS